MIKVDDGYAESLAHMVYRVDGFKNEPNTKPIFRAGWRDAPGDELISDRLGGHSRTSKNR